MTKAEFREFYRKYNPDRTITDEQLDEFFDAAADQFEAIDANQVTGLSLTDNAPASQGSDTRDAALRLLGLLAYSTALRWAWVASGTFWINRLLKNSGRPEKIRVRDAYMATIAMRHLTRVVTEAAMGTARNESQILDRVQEHTDSLKLVNKGAKNA